MSSAPLGLIYDFEVVIRARWSAIVVGSEIASPIKAEKGGRVHFTGRGRIVGKIGSRPGKERLYRITLYVRTTPDPQEREEAA